MPAADGEQSIFLAALDLKAPVERAAYLQSACGGDAALLASVQGLLAAHERGDSFLDGPPLAGPATVDERPIAEGPGTVIGPYKLLQQIGEGGMGTVFMAEQEEPVRRRVALKIIKPGMDSRQVVARFEAERQALAMMDHPNIARVFDAGTTQTGRPYFVMELVHGVPITQYCDANRLTPRQRLELFVPVCRAIQHAHQKGVIHRDIKPSNVLVTMYDDRPVPKVIDFGVAKAVEQRLTEKTLFTQFGTLVGTFEYMSPEQAEMNALGVDTRSDVFSLGVLLYELLTGTTPLERARLREAAYGEIVRLIREEEAPRPSVRLSSSGALAKVAAARKTEPGTLSRLVRGELDWVVMRCLEKDRTRRYETASALARDVERHLKDEPVEARPPSAGYRLLKFVKRNRGPVLAASLVLLAVLAGIVGTSWGWVEALAQRDDAVQARRLALANAAEAKANEQKATQSEKLAKDNEAKAEWRLYASRIDLAQREWETQNLPLFYHYLNQCRPGFRGWEHDLLYTLANQHHQTLRGHKDGITCVAFSPDGKLTASAGYGNPDKQGGGFLPGEVRLWDVASGQVLRTLTGHKGSVKSVAFSPDSKSLASASIDNKGGPGEIKIWDVASGRSIRTLKSEKPKDVELFLSVAFSPDGKRLASGSLTGSYPSPGPDGKLPASGSLTSKVDPFVKIWDVASGREVLALKGHSDKVTSVAFSPDGKRLASASYDQTVKVWDTASGQVILTIKTAAASPSGVVQSVAFSPDGKRLAGGYYGNLGLVKCWDAASGQEVLTLKRHTGGVWGVAFSPDGKRLASASGDRTVKVWEAASGREILTLRGHSDNVQSVAFSPDSKSLASAGGDGAVKLWDLARTQGVLTIKARDFAFSPNGNRLATSADLDLKLWDVANGKVLRTLIESPPKKAEEGGFNRGSILSAFSPDGKLLAASAGGTLKLWDAGSGKEVRTLMKQRTPNERGFSCMAEAWQESEHAYN